MILLTISSVAFGQAPNLRFEQLNFDDGLSDNHINTITQDDKGFIWIGTKDGLNRYDGYNFEVFKTSEDKFSISNNTIDCMYEDSKGNLWIGTFEGLNMLERSTGHFLNRTNNDKLNLNKLKGDIYDITEDQNGNIWVATAWLGVVVLNNDGVAYEFSVEDKGPHKLSSNTVSSIVQDEEGNIWIGTTNGLNKVSADLTTTREIILERNNMNARSINDLLIDKSGNLWIATNAGLALKEKGKDEMQYFFFDPSNPFDFASERNILNLCEGNDGLIYMGSGRNGLLVIDKNKNIYPYQTNGSSNITDNHINSIFIDNANSLWVGTNGQGINYSNSKTNMFSSYLNSGQNKSGLDEGSVTSFYEDAKNNLWISIDGGGLYKRSSKTLQFEKIVPSDQKQSDLPKNIKGISSGSNNKLWFATFGNGIVTYDISTGTFGKVAAIDNTEIGEELSCITKDSKNRIWVGSETSGACYFNQKNGTVITFKNSPDDPNSLSYNQVNFIFEDSKTNIWIGTNYGLNMLQGNSEQFKRFYPDTTANSSISNVAVTCMYEDNNGILWIGTAGGLNTYDPNTGQFTHLKSENGMSSNVIYSIIGDDQNNIWVSTDNGITYISTKGTLNLRTFNQKDGLQGKEFSKGSGFMNKEGVLFFGGVNGFTQIVPGNMKKNTTPPPVHLTGLKLFYEPIIPGEVGSILTGPIGETKKIQLDYSQNVLTFEFTALNFIVSSENQYKYKLEGFDKKWIDVKNLRSATYTNLNPGTYTFKVQASNNDGVWNTEGTSITVVITPPFWMTWWFQLIIGLIVLAIIYLIFRLRVNAIRNRNKILEQRVQERTEQIETQKEEIESQRDEILYHKEQIEESIEVGKIIQDAILPPVELIQSKFPQSFVYYQAKDIVSGDFYWFYQKGRKSYIATADCTGHGVAGGFLTMIGQNHLHQIADTDNNLSAAEILDQLNQKVIKSLRQRPDHMDTRDGMDITLCIFEEGSNEIQFAGAKNPLYIIRKGTKEIEKLDVDIFSIGIPIRGDVKSFQNHTTTLNTGDTLYIFSDGYADQFNEAYEEKFKHHRFRDLLIDIHQKDMEEQLSLIRGTINKWKGQEEQTDDMLVMGIRI